MADIQFSENELKFLRCWSGVAGARYAYLECEEMLRKKAGEAFMRGDDQKAAVLRSAAYDIGRVEKQKREELDAYISEGARRSKAAAHPEEKK